MPSGRAPASGSTEPRTKRVGGRVAGQGDLRIAAPFFELVVRLRRDKPFIPRGVHRFHSFEESQAWSMQMMARRSSRVPRG